MTLTTTQPLKRVKKGERFYGCGKKDSAQSHARCPREVADDPTFKRRVIHWCSCPCHTEKS